MKNSKKRFYLIILFLLIPLNVLPANLSLLEINRAFHLLKNEIVDLHLSFSGYSQNYSPEEEAVIVLTKKATFGKLLNLNLTELPKDFIITAALKGGLRLAGASANPVDLLEKELLNYSIQQIINWLLQEEINMSGGEISISYQDMNKKKRTENLLYSVTKNKDKEISITIYSGNYINPPLSIPGPVISSSLWKMNDFKKDLLSPFSITFSGDIEKTTEGAFFWKNNPEIEITFYEEPFSLSFSSPTFLNKIKNFANSLFSNTFSFFTSAENILKSSISVMIGQKDKKITPSSTVVDLEEIKNQKNTEEKFQEKSTEQKEESLEEKTLITDPKKSIVLEKVEINSALGEDLERIVGIGPTYAERIIENRPYCDLSELTKVPGIGETTLNKIKEQGIAYTAAPLDCSNKISHGELEDKEKLIETLLKVKEILEKIEDSRKTESDEDIEDKNNEKDEKIKDIEINSASLSDLTLIIGVGSITAEKIIENRPYCTLDDLIKIQGIGETTLSNIKDQGIAYVNPPDSCFEKNDRGSSRSLPLPEDDNYEEESDDEEKEENIEINSATLNDLQKIIGIGPAYAERIIENRPYCTLDDLIKIQGIGETTLSNIKDQGIAYVNPPDSCFQDEDEEKDNDENETESPIFDIIIVGAETYQNIVLVQEIIDSKDANKEQFEVSIISMAELIIEKILEKHFTIGLTKPEFIN